jgi:hypothetical protein
MRQLYKGHNLANRWTARLYRLAHTFFEPTHDRNFLAPTNGPSTAVPPPRPYHPHNRATHTTVPHPYHRTNSCTTTPTAVPPTVVPPLRPCHPHNRATTPTAVPQPCHHTASRTTTPITAPPTTVPHPRHRATHHRLAVPQPCHRTTRLDFHTPADPTATPKPLFSPVFSTLILAKGALTLARMHQPHENTAGNFSVQQSTRTHLPTFPRLCVVATPRRAIKYITDIATMATGTPGPSTRSQSTPVVSPADP